MAKNKNMIEFSEPNDDAFFKLIIKMVAYLSLLILNILFYYHFSIDLFGGIISDCIFWLFLFVIVIIFNIEHRWAYETSGGNAQVKLQSNLLGLNIVTIALNGKRFKREIMKGSKFIKLEFDDFEGFSSLVIKKGDSNQLLCRFEK
jgi:hypothetical protein